MTLASAFIIVVLLLGEFFDYRSIRVESSLVVDSGRKEKMAIEFDISFPKIPCYSKLRLSIVCARGMVFFFISADTYILLIIVLTLDVMDVAGEHQADITHSVFKVQLTPDGKEIKREKTTSTTHMMPCLTIINCG